MNYTEKITLEQALDLQNKIKAGEMPDIQVYSFNASGLNIVNLNGLNIGQVYLDHNYLLLTRPDYAQYIQGNKPLPDGYGYPSNPFDSGIYDELPYKFYSENNKWAQGSFSSYGQLFTIIELEWYKVAFLLTDLARVEAEAVISKMERTEINAAQVIWMYKNKRKTTHWQNGREWDCFASEDLEQSITDKYELLTSTYNSLPDEFKALAEPQPLNKQSFGEIFEGAARASMPAHFEADWKEAKYKELERQLQEATASADAKQDKIHELEKEVENYEAMLHRGRRSSQYFQEKNNAHCEIIKAQEKLIELWKQASFIKPVQ